MRYSMANTGEQQYREYLLRQCRSGELTLTSTALNLNKGANVLASQILFLTVR